MRVIACEYDDIKILRDFFRAVFLSVRLFLGKCKAGRDFFSCVKRIAEKTGEKPALFPVGAKTLEYVSGAASQLKSVCGLLVPSPEQLDFFNDKARICEFARSLGIAVPRAYSLNESFDFPVVVKPVCGEKAGLSAAARYVIARDREKLVAAAKNFENITGQPPVIQEYLGGYGAGCSVSGKGRSGARVALSQAYTRVPRVRRPVQLLYKNRRAAAFG